MDTDNTNQNINSVGERRPNAVDFGTGNVSGETPEVQNSGLRIGSDSSVEPQPQSQSQSQPQVAPTAPVAPAMPVASVVVPEPTPAPTPVPTPASQAPVAAPVVAPMPPVAPAAPQPQPVVVPAPMSVKKASPGKRLLTKDEIMEREAKRNKRLTLGCLGSFGIGALLLIILIFVFLGGSGTEQSSLASSLGINQQSLVNTLILIVNIFFGIGALVTFLLSIGGIFKASMARKDDKITKRKGYVMAIGSFISFILIIMMWVGASYYLNSKKVDEVKQITGVVTTPSVTTNLTAPVEIKFDASHLPYDTVNYDIISYYWNYGDGKADIGSDVELHRYEKKGRYDVELTITFKNKKTGEETTQSPEPIPVSISNESIVATIEVNADTGNAPFEVTFNGSKSFDPDGEIATYAWEIDGGGFEEGESTLTHEFNQIGEYVVKLRVTNTKGEYALTEKKIIVEAGDVPVPVIEVLNNDGDKYYTEQSYTFDASKSTSPVGTIKRYEWDFGDGSSLVKTRTAQHIFTKEGTFKVLLALTDEDGNEAETEMVLEVVAPASAPKAKILTIPAKANADDNFIEGIVPFEVTFDATKSIDTDDDIVDYQWDFDGDKEYDSTGETTAYVFKEPGTYTVNLIVVDSEGAEGKAILLVKALSRGLEAKLTADPVSGIVPLVVSFDATASSYSDGQIVGFEWDFGDGALPRSDVGQVTYKYTKIGNFTVSVKVRTNDGTEKTATALVSVRQVPLKSCFEMTPEVGEAPLTVLFNPGCSTGTIAKYRWNFGDGETSSERKPTYTFENPGTYEVTLEVSDSQNLVDTISEFVTVQGDLT
ncbi:PKD domain-containing protein [Patescibacteria group bacterium]|nr:PKD domain-containing protein [Patescibacteria group bacterium]